MGAQAAAALSRTGRLGVVPPPVRACTSVPLGAVPPGLTLDRVARSHGWCMLPPFGYDASSHLLHRRIELEGAALPVWVDATWTLHSGAVADLGPAAGQLRWCLGLDDDVAGAPPDVQASRMLRCPTVWEDLAKTLLTTNCSWAATVGMVSRLVDSLGAAGTFPSPVVVADAGEGHLRTVVRVGYRAGSLHRLAVALTGAQVQPERWRDSAVTDREVMEEVLRLPGFGPYAAEGMLGLLGRPRGLAVDSWIRARLGGLDVAEVRQRYASHGRWAGAQLWQDVTAEWFTSA